MAWDDDEPDLSARRVWGDGTMDGAAFAVVADVWGADVAYGTESGLFLVTMEDWDYIYAQRYGVPVAGFAGTPLTGTAPLTVTFSNTSLPVSYTTA